MENGNKSHNEPTSHVAATGSLPLSQTLPAFPFPRPNEKFCFFAASGSHEQAEALQKVTDHIHTYSPFGFWMDLSKIVQDLRQESPTDGEKSGIKVGHITVSNDQGTYYLDIAILKHTHAQILKRPS